MPDTQLYFIYYNPTAAIGISAEYSNVYTYKFGEDDIPCWSLAALLDILYPNITLDHTEGKGWSIIVNVNVVDTEKVIADNPIDACYKIILNLHEQKLL